MTDAPSPGRRSEFVRGPKWRTRTSPARRHRAALATFVVVIVVGTLTLLGCMWVLDRLGAPGWLVTAPWWAPTIGAVLWTLVRPRVSGLSDDDDDSWFGYSIRWALVGEQTPRPAALRVLVAAVVGAPVVWAVAVFAVLTLTGIL